MKLSIMFFPFLKKIDSHSNFIFVAQMWETFKHTHVKLFGRLEASIPVTADCYFWHFGERPYGKQGTL